MKRIIAPLALALLSTVAVADDSNNIQKHFNVMRQYLPATSSSADNLPAWNNINYKNFTKKTIPFDKSEDCVIARNHAMSQVNATLVINDRDTTDNKLYSTAQTVNNNIEIRISCKPFYKSLEAMIETTLYRRPSTVDFNLVYETATRRSDDEILELKIENAREQENAKKQYEDTIKSKVNDALNLE